MYYPCETWYWWPMLPMSIWAIIAILGVVLAGVLLSTASGKPPERTPQSPEDILGRRYARGEIDTEEYKRRLFELGR